LRPQFHVGNLALEREIEWNIRGNLLWFAVSDERFEFPLPRGIHGCPAKHRIAAHDFGLVNVSGF
jgi:hypothetical protein